jgi:hypothetical protein
VSYNSEMAPDDPPPLFHRSPNTQIRRHAAHAGIRSSTIPAHQLHPAGIASSLKL